MSDIFTLWPFLNDFKPLDFQDFEPTKYIPKHQWQENGNCFVLDADNQLVAIRVVNHTKEQLNGLLEQLPAIDTLQQLALYQCALDEKSKYIGECSSVIDLVINKCDISQLPLGINKLTKLKSLYLADNKITQLPDSLVGLSKLEILDLQNNCLQQLPERLTQLTSMKQLLLGDNALLFLPPQIGQLVNLEYLNLENNKLKELPSSTNALSKLVNLYLSNNQLDKLPEVTSLKNLHGLFLSDNKLYELPQSVVNLVNLRRLELDNNQLKHLPKGIESLTNLRKLLIFNNQLKILPDGFCKLVNLQVLNARNNQLKQLPVSFGLLTNLESLNLVHNQIKELPESFIQLVNLFELNLSNNELYQLPADMGELVNLEKLELLDNPVVIDTLIDKIKLSASEQIQYLLEIQNDNTARLNEAKVLVLGEERVGKTSLINRIFGRPMDANQSSTEGIDIETLEYEAQIKCNIWDFAGQEITHQTHQFFLRENSLYLLVIDAQKEDDDVNTHYWLNTIKVTAGEKAPIIVLVNKMDLNSGFRFDRNRYERDFNIVNVLYLTANDEKAKVKRIDTIEDLKLAIGTQVKQIENLSLKFPPSWLAVKQELQEYKLKGKDYIESGEFENLCDDYGINEKLQDTLLIILDQIGTIVTYRHIDKFNLMEIINPKWVTNGVYKILRSDEMNQSDAVLSKEQFGKIFKGDPKYKNRRHFNWLRKLMLQFEIAFNIAEDTVLIPARLPLIEPEFTLSDYQTGFNFRFEYSDILKKNVISHFIVLTHNYITTDELKYWRRGVFLEYGRDKIAKAVVIADYNDNSITVAINSSDRNAKELLTVIRHRIGEINGKQLNVEEQVPLTEYGKVVGYCDYEKLLDHEEQGLDVIREKIGGKYKNFEIAPLLDGYRIEEYKNFNYKIFIQDLMTICYIETKSCVTICNEDENSTNDRLRNALIHKGYCVPDQSRGGPSYTGKSPGSRDIVICDKVDGDDQCIIEAQDIKKFNRSKLLEHYERLINYDTVGNPVAIIVNYVKKEDFEGEIRKYQDTFEHKGFELIASEKRSVVKGQTYNGKQRILHIFVNFWPDKHQ